MMHACFVHTELLRDLLLEESQVQSALAEVVTDGGEALGICRR